MSLLNEAMTDCQMIHKITEDDGYGGEITRWIGGSKFKAALYLNTSVEAKTAMAAGVTDLYTVTTLKSKKLDYHDVFKRLSDGRIFRVTSDGEDKKTPESAGLNMRQVSAEEWSLPNG